MTITRDEFYEKFPHVVDLPSHPQCKECFGMFEINVQDEDDHHIIVMREWHNKACPHCLRNGKSFLIDELPAYCRPE